MQTQFKLKNIFWGYLIYFLKKSPEFNIEHSVMNIAKNHLIPQIESFIKLAANEGVKETIKE